LGFELRDSLLVGRCSTTWTILSTLLCFSYFSDRVSFSLPGSILDLWSSYLCLSYSWDDRLGPTCLVHLLRCGCTNLFPMLPSTSVLPMSTSWVTGIIGKPCCLVLVTSSL
jgi:hypothetical protein